MIGIVCAEVKNFFSYDIDRHMGDWTISNGVLSPSLDLPTDYIRIIGSKKNNGVHKVSEMQLKDEIFHGAIWIMSPPDDFLNLVSEIEQWEAKYGGATGVVSSPYQSESLGAYSYSMRTGGYSSNSSGSSSPTWQNVFKPRLNIYRRLREL